MRNYNTDPTPGPSPTREGKGYRLRASYVALPFNYIKFAVLPLLAVLLTACSKDDAEDDQPPQNVTRWECILFGSYPANEVVSGSFNAVDDYTLVEGDVIVDATLYSQLEGAQWANDDTEIGGKRYHRLNAAGAVSLGGIVIRKVA